MSTDESHTDRPAGPLSTTDVGASAGRRYLRSAAAMLDGLEAREWPNIGAAAELVATSLANGGTLYAFGTGHSHMLAEELYYRAGGLVRVRPILFEGLMLHGGAALSTSLERLPGLAALILDDHPVAPGDVLLIASNSGGNAVITEMALLARQRGMRSVAITNLAHATSRASREQGPRRLHELADVVIDNGGVVGDAVVEIEGLGAKVGPTSTIIGAAIANAIVAEAVERLVGAGMSPDVFSSANVAGGDETNARLLRELP